jgi:hypothetical protein
VLPGRRVGVRHLRLYPPVISCLLLQGCSGYIGKIERLYPPVISEFEKKRL